MTRSDDQRIADILDTCDELNGVIELRREGGTSEQVLLRAAHRYHRTDPGLIWSYAEEEAPSLSAALRV